MTTAAPITHLPTMLTFPDRLDRVRDSLRAQADTLQSVAAIYADAIAGGGLVHV